MQLLINILILLPMREMMMIVKFYNTMNFCLVPLYIEPNKKSSERLLVSYKKLIKSIWPSITLLKQY